MGNLSEFLTSKGLSGREAEVASCIASGMSNNEAAKQLTITEKTVKFHLTNIYKKLQTKTRAQLIVKCIPYATTKLTQKTNA